MKAVCLLSGGVDSATALALALQENQEVVAININYGQTHLRERVAARQIVDYYARKGAAVVSQEYDLPEELFTGAKSTLVGEKNPQPHLTYQELAEQQGPSPTVVPFRNALLLSIATARAVIEEASLIYAGMHGEDARNFAYPDCTANFLGPFAACVYVGTYHQVQLKIPFQWYMKKDIVALGHNLKVPFELTWSCYEGGTVACARCPTCTERLAAFAANSLIDPIQYAR